MNHKTNRSVQGHTVDGRLWTPARVRNAVIPATGAAGLRSIRTIFDEGAEGAFSGGYNPDLAGGAAMTALMSMRAYGQHDPRLAEAAKAAGIEVPHLFGSPSPDSLHIPTYMPNTLVRYTNSMMIGSRIMPVIGVTQRSDVVGSVPFGTGLSPVDVRITGPTAQVRELSWNISNQGTYRVQDYGLMTLIPNKSITTADPPFEVRQTTAEILADTLELMQEMEIASTVGTSGNYASGYSLNVSAAADKWNNPASDPVTAVRNGSRTLGRTNDARIVLVLGWDVFIALQAHPKVLASIYSRGNTTMGATPMTVTEAMLASLFEVDEVIVGRAKKNTANDGQTVALADVWSGFAALMLVQNRPSPTRTWCFGYQYRFGGDAMQTQFIPNLLAGAFGGEYCKVTHSTDVFVTSNRAGYLFYNVLA